MASTSQNTQDVIIDPGTISTIIDDQGTGLKVSLNVTDDEVERVRKEAEQQNKGDLKEDNADRKGDEVGIGEEGDGGVSGEGDKVEKSDDPEEAQVAKNSDEPMGGDAVNVGAGGVEVQAIDVANGGNEPESGDEVKEGEATEVNDETEEGNTVEEAMGVDEPNGDDEVNGDDDIEVSDESDVEQSEGSDITDYDDDTDDDEAVEVDELEEGDRVNLDEQTNGVELANINEQAQEDEESDEEESDSDDDSDFEEEQSGSDRGFIKIMTLGDSFGVIIQGSGATLSPKTERKAKSGKYITIQLRNAPNIPKYSNVVIELQPDVCELFGKDAYNSMLMGDWSKMIKIAKKKGCPYPEVLNKLRTSQGKAPIKIKQRN
ncbi:hypothetical protein HF086_012152 [Spodoptera exigua]|uniref:Uncharacterized protein n=1 Tax=Spodoptera exigua TaxID=7107 RepID=A0A922M726_SPOEX|nr:hypothetical protein HF086_012152 [Spodoptera exigua]